MTSRYAIAYAGAALTFLVVDLIWLTLAAGPLYRAHVGDLMADTINLPAALGFYFIYIAGITIFAIAPALRTGLWRTATVFGALLGFVAYATYDLTNLATLRGWPVGVAMMDIAWGAFVTGLSATAGFLAARRLRG